MAARAGIPAFSNRASATRTGTYGVALSEAQLNASANVPGIFDFSPSAGRVLPAGADQPLTVVFTPQDHLTYNSTQKIVELDVAPASLTIRADDKVRAQGVENPDFTATYSGFVNGDTVENLDQSVTFATPAGTQSPPGVYLITPGGASDSNYDIHFVAGTLTITAGAAVQLSGSYSESGAFRLEFEANAARSYEVQASSDLTHWQAVERFAETGGRIQFSDEANSGGRRFYRVVELNE